MDWNSFLAFIRAATLFAGGLTLTLGLPSGLRAEDQPPALPGVSKTLSSDGQAIIDSDAHPWASIGQVNRSGYRSASMCTGTLIAPTVVLTAAHCLFDRATGRAFLPDEVIFLAGVRRAAYSARLTSRCFVIDPDYDPKLTPQLKNLYSDVALIILDRPSDLPIVPQVPVDEATAPPRSKTLVSVGYRRDRRFLPTADPSCKVIAAVDGSWITDCSTMQGTSGGPILLRDGNDLKITAIMSAKAAGNASIVVPRSRWQPLLHQASCGTTVTPTMKEDLPAQQAARKYPWPDCQSTGKTCGVGE